MSRLGIYKEKKYLFTHRDPQSGKYWTDEINDGMWVDSKKINFDTTQPKKTRDKFYRK